MEPFGMTNTTLTDPTANFPAIDVAAPTEADQPASPAERRRRAAKAPDVAPTEAELAPLAELLAAASADGPEAVAAVQADLDALKRVAARGASIAEPEPGPAPTEVDVLRELAGLTEEEVAALTELND